MAETPPPFIKDDFSPAQPVSFQWYNDVARLLKTPGLIQESMRLLPGYNQTATQTLMVKDGTIQWVTVNSDCT